MNKKGNDNAFSLIALIKCILLAVIGIFVLILASRLFKDEFGYFLNWWLVLVALGVVFMPLSGILFRNFRDSGWMFSKIIGIAISGWLVWYLSSMHILKFTAAGCYAILGMCLVLNTILIIAVIKKDAGRRRKNPETFAPTYRINAETIVSILAAEVVFLAVFVLWTYIKGFKPDAYGTTEKLMDFGFMQAIDKSEYMPPEDLWLSGNSLNYYYVGQFIATYLSKISGVGVEYGYNFMMMVLAAFAFSLPCSLIVNVSAAHLSDRRSRTGLFSSVFPYFAGGLAGIAVSFAGNMHYLVYARFIPWLRTMLGLDKMAEELEYSFAGYWFPNATRYIGYNPETNDKTIHEFPLYSFVLGDLHAHVLNIIFVFTVIAVLFAWLQYRKKSMDASRINKLYIKTDKNQKGCIFGIPDFMKEVFHPAIILTGFFIGLFHTTNFWDYPIYFVVAGAVILFSNAVIYNFSILTVKLTALHAVVVLAVAKLVCLPFTLSFNQISTSICISENHTPLYQLVILWGLPAICTFVFLASLIKQQKIAGIFKNEDKTALGRTNSLYRFIGNLEVADMFVLVLGLCAAGLVLIPELVYVKDIYSGDYKRANTMFKLTYQAFIMFGMAMGYIIAKFLFFARTKGQRIFAVVTGLCVIMSVGYFFNSTEAWFGNYLEDGSKYKGLNAGEYLKNINEEDYLAANWINENIEGRPVMLEVNGDSYTDYCRISVRTGLPTLLGWRTHEWLWQSDGSGEIPEIVTKRAEDIETIYTSETISDIESLIEEYNIEYIYVGKLEREKYDNPVNHDLLLELGDVIYPEGFSNEMSDNTSYIIKIER